MASEIAEQPDLWRRILESAPSDVDAVARRIRATRPRFVLLAGRGTSDHAALYAKYLVEIWLEMPAGLVSPSTTTVFDARPDLRDVLLIAISQSGGSPDLVRTVEIGRANGATTLAITNHPGSALDDAAELHLDIAAGSERSVAATKSYTAELLVIHLLLAKLADRAEGAVPRLPDWGAEVLSREGQIREIAERYLAAERMLVTGRGYSYPTAREAALKLMETCYVSAHAFSGADILHGPLALVAAGVPVLAVTPAGRGGDAMRPTLARLTDAGANILCVGATGRTDDDAPDIALPAGIPEELSPLVEILPFQLLALALALARGGDPDAPEGLSKVTQTW